MKSLSILLPTYNCLCVQLVKTLYRQCEAVEGLRYEIIVADDGSTNKDLVEQNKQILLLNKKVADTNNTLTTVNNKVAKTSDMVTSVNNKAAEPNQVIYIIRKENVGRSRIRNFLAQQALYDWVLFIDGDLELDNPHYIENFLASSGDLVVGGISISGLHSDNLRWLNEKAHEPQTKAIWRRKHPLELHTNFLVRREALIAHPFDEGFTRYGYEDVLLGRTLIEAGLTAEHIDNPVLFSHFESNECFLKKTEEALQTLFEFREQLRDANHLLPFVERLKRWKLLPLLHLSYKLLNKPLRRQLEGNKPRLFLFKIYRMIYMSHLYRSNV